jgi:hypothetical protein
VDVCLHGEAEAIGCAAAAQLDQIHRRQLPEEVVQGCEREADPSFRDQSRQGAVCQRRTGSPQPMYS